MYPNFLNKFLTFVLVFGSMSGILLIPLVIVLKYKPVPPTIIGSFLYYFVQRLFIALGTSEQMPIILATWLPSVILLGLGLFLISFVEE